jgi:hypothetical protein
MIRSGEHWPSVPVSPNLDVARNSHEEAFWGLAAELRGDDGVLARSARFGTISLLDASLEESRCVGALFS